MVAAWMSALTGVGPAMASGNHVCKGSWADFPTAPPSSSKAVMIANDRARRPSFPCPQHDFLNLQGPKMSEEQEKSDGQGSVTHPGNHESLAGCIAVFRLLVPETYQKVAAKPYPLPAQVEQQQSCPPAPVSAWSRRKGSSMRKSGCSLPLRS